jgi:hypothetical protein
MNDGIVVYPWRSKFHFFLCGKLYGKLCGKKIAAWEISP